MSIKSRNRKIDRDKGKNENSILTSDERIIINKKRSFFSTPSCPYCNISFKYSKIFLAFAKQKTKCNKCKNKVQYKTTKATYILILIFLVVAVSFNFFLLNYASSFFIIALPTMFLSLIILLLTPLTFELKKVKNKNKKEEI